MEAEGRQSILARHADPDIADRLPAHVLLCDGRFELLFTENETNTERLFHTPNASPYVKDGFDASLVHGRTEAVNPARTGTKACAHYLLEVPAGKRPRSGCGFRPRTTGGRRPVRSGVRGDVRPRIREADEFTPR
jgi:hypothetical protein